MRATLSYQKELKFRHGVMMAGRAITLDTYSSRCLSFLYTNYSLCHSSSHHILYQISSKTSAFLLQQSATMGRPDVKHDRPLRGIVCEFSLKYLLVKYRKKAPTEQEQGQHKAPHTKLAADCVGNVDASPFQELGLDSV